MAATDWLAQGTLVLASNNKGKIAEFETLFAQLDLPVQVIPQGQLNIEDAVEERLLTEEISEESKLEQLFKDIIIEN